jgi:hypothetical protein
MADGTNINPLMVKLLQTLGYSGEYEPGVCHGYSTRWLEAVLLGEEDEFNQRMNRLIPLARAQLDLYEQGQISKAQFSEEFREFMPFFDSLILYHLPFNYSVLYDGSRLTQRQFEQAAALAASSRMQAQGGLHTLYSESVIGEASDIEDYLRGLEAQIDALDEQPAAPVTFSLSSLTHTLALSYQKGVGWKLMDIGKHPSKTFTQEGRSLLATQIASSFRGQDGIDDNTVAFRATLITTGVREPIYTILKEQLEQFKRRNIQRLSSGVDYASWNARLFAMLTRSFAMFKRQAALSDASRDPELLALLPQFGVTTLCHYAIEIGSPAAIEQMATRITDIPLLIAPDKFGRTIAHTAAERGSPDVLNAVLAIGARFDQPDNSGKTGIDYIVQRQDPKLIIALAKAGYVLGDVIDRDRDKADRTVLHRMSMEGSVDTIRALVKSGANLLAMDQVGLTPIASMLIAQRADLIQFVIVHAIEKNDAAIIKYCIDQGVDFSAYQLNTVVPFLRAQGRTAIVELLEAHYSDIIEPPANCAAEYRAKLGAMQEEESLEYNFKSKGLS